MQCESGDRIHKKHPCPDCKMCQGCSESRCCACRNKTGQKKRKKLDFDEQIALWESLNRTGNPL